MIYVDDRILQLYNAEDREIRMHLEGMANSRYDNDDIVSVTITDEVNPSSSLCLGNVSSRKVVAKVILDKYIDVHFPVGSTIGVGMQIVTSSGSSCVFLGNFRVYDLKKDDNGQTATITGYDYMQRIVETAGDIYHNPYISGGASAEDVINDVIRKSAYNLTAVVDSDTISTTSLRNAEPCDYDSNGEQISTAGSYGVGKNHLVFIPAYVDSVTLVIHSTQEYTSPLKVCIYDDMSGNELVSSSYGYQTFNSYSVESENGGYKITQNISVSLLSNLYPLYMGFAIAGSETVGANDTYEVELVYPEHTPLIDNLKLDPSVDINASPGKTLSYMSGIMATNLLACPSRPINEDNDAIYPLNTSTVIKALPYQETGFEITPDMTYLNGFSKSSDEPIEISYVATGPQDNIITVGEGDFGLNFENPYITDELTAQFILARYSHLKLIPGTIKYRGNPYVRAGDIIIVQDVDGTKYNFLICKNELRFNGGLSCTLTCNLSPERTSSYVSTPNTVSVTDRVSSFYKAINDAETYKTLWSGETRLGANESVTLSEPIIDQLTGIILEWKLASNGTSSPYGDAAYQYLPKTARGSCVFDSGAVVFTTNCRKRIQVNDQSITGTEYNTQSGTAGGITYDNSRLVLVAVYGK